MMARPPRCSRVRAGTTEKCSSNAAAGFSKSRAGPQRYATAQEDAMASIRKEILLHASAADVWDVVRDVGAVHTRFAPGFVTNTALEDGARVVTFANGFVVRELIVDVDDRARRLAYAAVGGRLTHHSASFQIYGQGDQTRLVWTADLLP